MAKTLEITGDESRAWELLGELAGCYGDNGGDPDGSAWLPSQTISEDEAEQVLEAGLGRMVEVMYANDAGIRNWLGWPPTDDQGDEIECDETEIEQMQAAVEDKTAAWAHYGGYGVSDSTWVFVRKA